MGFLSDPSGGHVGVWQPGEHQGFGVVNEHGAPSWFELHTLDYDTALEFYRTVFGWQTETVSDTSDFRYTVLMHGEEKLAGVMDASAYLPEGVPSHWSIYFWVDDTDAALAKVESLGGSVLEPAMDTPYGRLATVVDPGGVRFKLMAANDQMPARQG